MAIFSSAFFPPISYFLSLLEHKTQIEIEQQLESFNIRPTAMRMLKFGFNMTDDGMVGQQVFAGEATRLAYMTEEAKEGRDAFLEKRKPNFPKKWIP